MDGGSQGRALRSSRACYLTAAPLRHPCHSLAPHASRQFCEAVNGLVESLLDPEGKRAVGLKHNAVCTALAATSTAAERRQCTKRHTLHATSGLLFPTITCKVDVSSAPVVNVPQGQENAIRSLPSPPCSLPYWRRCSSC